MNLRSRIGGILQGKASALDEAAPDSRALAQEKERRAELSLQLHMRQMRAVRDRELNELRQIMAKRSLRGMVAGERLPTSRGTGGLAPSRPTSAVDATQMVSMINELEVKVLSEPMGLGSRSPGRNRKPGLERQRDDPATGHSNQPRNGPASPHSLDDAALMVAARRWDQAADLLLEALAIGDLRGGTDWVVRSAIDLLERGGQSGRAAALRKQYEQRRRRPPRHIVPPAAGVATLEPLQATETPPWRCPSRLGGPDIPALQALLLQAHDPVTLDWSMVSGIEATSLVDLQRLMETAMASHIVFVHIGLPKLIRAARQALHAEPDSMNRWTLWLALLNWSGLRKTHRSAAAAFAQRFQCPPPVYGAVRCVCQNLPAQGNGPVEDRVYHARLVGDLSMEHVNELARLEALAPKPGRLVLLDCRLLVSVDFFFGAELLNWVIRRQSRGESIGIAHAHPLLGHFLRILGFQGYARLHGLPTVPVPARA